jgi:hypothetical protein
VDQATLITPEYVEQNRRLHDIRPGYGANGGRYAEHVYGLIAAFHPQSVIDFGAGKGMTRGAVQYLINERHRPPLQKLRSRAARRHRAMNAKMPEWTEYEPSLPGKDAVPSEPADLLICTDVAEHFEPETLEANMDLIAELTRHICFITFSLKLSNKTLPDGRNTHLIVEDAQFWRDEMLKRFALIKAVPWRNDETLILVGFK